MTRDALVAELASWIGEIAETAPPVLGDETDLVKDLGLDSLALAELAAKLRLRHKIRLRPGELVGKLQVGQVVDLVLAKIASST